VAIRCECSAVSQWQLRLLAFYKQSGYKRPPHQLGCHGHTDSLQQGAHRNPPQQTIDPGYSVCYCVHCGVSIIPRVLLSASDPTRDSAP
jgi:hypothetical protein